MITVVLNASMYLYYTWINTERFILSSEQEKLS